jgi:hypothetical protein
MTDSGLIAFSAYDLKRGLFSKDSGWILADFWLPTADFRRRT